MTQDTSKMRCNSPHSIPNTNRENGKVEGDFYALQKHELLALREAKLINNSGFVHLALRLENPYCDRDIEIIPKEFASRWNIPQSSVYEALGKLEAAGAINIKSGKVIIKWSNHSQQKDDSGNPENLQKPRMNYGNPERILETQNELRKPRIDSGNPENRPLEPAPAKDFNSLRLIQNIQTDQTLSERTSEDEILINKILINKEPESVEQKETLTSSTLTIVSSEVDQYSALRLAKKSSRFGFQVSERHSDLIYQGEATPWLEEPQRSQPNEPRFNQDFLRWHGERNLKKFQKLDIYQAMADFNCSLLNEPNRIKPRWMEYELYQLHRTGNILTRTESGEEVSENEKASVQKHLAVVSRSESARETLEQFKETASTPTLPVDQPNYLPLPTDETGLTDNCQAYQLVNVSTIAPMSDKYDPQNTKAAREAAKAKLNHLSNLKPAETLVKRLSKVSEMFANTEKAETQLEKELHFVNQMINSPYLEQCQKGENWCDSNGFTIFKNADGSREAIKF